MAGDEDDGWNEDLGKLNVWSQSGLHLPLFLRNSDSDSPSQTCPPPSNLMIWPSHPQQSDPTSYTSELPYFPTPMTFLPGDFLSVTPTTSIEMDHISPHQALKYGPPFSNLLWHPLIFIPPLVVILPSISAPLMNTRKKNKSAHAGIPDMTPFQLTSAQLASANFPPQPQAAHRSLKKLTKDQQIAALKDELRATQELILNV